MKLRFDPIHLPFANLWSLILILLPECWWYLNMSLSTIQIPRYLCAVSVLASSMAAAADIIKQGRFGSTRLYRKATTFASCKVGHAWGCIWQYHKLRCMFVYSVSQDWFRHTLFKQSGDGGVSFEYQCQGLLFWGAASALFPWSPHCVSYRVPVHMELCSDCVDTIEKVWCNIVTVVLWVKRLSLQR